MKGSWGDNDSQRSWPTGEPIDKGHVLWLEYAMRDDRASVSSCKRVLELVSDDNNETLDTKKKRSTKRFSLRAARSDETLTKRKRLRNGGVVCGRHGGSNTARSDSTSMPRQRVFDDKRNRETMCIALTASSCDIEVVRFWRAWYVMKVKQRK